MTGRFHMKVVGSSLQNQFALPASQNTYSRLVKRRVVPSMQVVRYMPATVSREANMVQFKVKGGKEAQLTQIVQIKTQSAQITPTSLCSKN
jgi:hypothetical protein